MARRTASWRRMPPSAEMAIRYLPGVYPVPEAPPTSGHPRSYNQKTRENKGQSSRRPRANRRRTGVTRAQARRDVGREALEEASLVGRRGVDDEVVEAELDVGRDALGGLVGVVRDDEAARRVDARCVREPLELDRIVDVLLGLGRQRERRPERAVPAGRGEVRVVRELDLDHALERRRVAARLAGALGEGRQERLGVELARLAAGLDEAVGVGAGPRRALRAARGDE